MEYRIEELKRDRFKEELEQLINRNSLENTCNTPDFILAEFMIRCLESFADCSNAREIWYDVKLRPSRTEK